MTTIAEALRTEIRSVLDADGKPFTVVVAARILKLADAAKAVLVASSDVDDVSPVTTLVTTATETFGTRATATEMFGTPFVGDTSLTKNGVPSPRDLR